MDHCPNGHWHFSFRNRVINQKIDRSRIALHATSSWHCVPKAVSQSCNNFNGWMFFVKSLIQCCLFFTSSFGSIIRFYSFVLHVVSQCLDQPLPTILLDMSPPIIAASAGRLSSGILNGTNMKDDMCAYARLVNITYGVTTANLKSTIHGKWEMLTSPSLL